MIKMLKMIYTIPASIGWTLVGVAAILTLVMAVKVGKMFVEMWQDRHAEECEEE